MYFLQVNAGRDATTVVAESQPQLTRPHPPGLPPHPSQHCMGFISRSCTYLANAMVHTRLLTETTARRAGPAQPMGCLGMQGGMHVVGGDHALQGATLKPHKGWPA
mmetsp:Transcript_42854/g.81734  ORF Transcript_42854/g.81734 Transcript_42854/m.81734 type:complete len:106 (-) Transcript_42854:983-1300(-)